MKKDLNDPKLPRCPDCLQLTVTVNIKSPFVDMSEEDCVNEECKRFRSGSEHIFALERQIAHQESIAEQYLATDYDGYEEHA